jgi:hypothetical protein
MPLPDEHEHELYIDMLGTATDPCSIVPDALIHCLIVTAVIEIEEQCIQYSVDECRNQSSFSTAVAAARSFTFVLDAQNVLQLGKPHHRVICSSKEHTHGCFCRMSHHPRHLFHIAKVGSILPGRLSLPVTYRYEVAIVHTISHARITWKDTGIYRYLTIVLLSPHPTPLATIPNYTGKLLERNTSMQ